MNPVVIYLVRSLAVGIFAANAVLLTAAGIHNVNSDTAWIAAFTGIQAAMLYAGIGAAVPQVEPNIGNKVTGDVTK